MAKRKSGLYDVGYGKPPAAGKFKKGVSGNPNGRPKGSKNLATLVQRVFSRKLVVTEKGRTRRISAAEAMLTKLMANALSGDIAAQRLSVTLIQGADGGDTAVASLFASTEDRALLLAALNDHGADEAAATPPKESSDE